MTRKLLFSIFYLFTLFSYSQMAPLSETAKVSVLTCGRGEELYTTFGHTGIRIYDTENNLDVVFNYGMFDFNEGNFYLKFVKGNLKYFVAASSFDEFLFEYKVTNREVVEQTLNLTLVQKQQLFELLTTSLYSDEKFYTYKFIDKNCTTMVMDKLNTILVDKNQIKKTSDTNLTYRQVLYPYFQNYFWYKLGINIIFGERVDNNATQLFLPVELMESLNKINVNGKPLVTTNQTIVTGQEPKFGFSFLNSIYLISTILLLILLLNKTFVLNIFLILLGIIGIFFIWVGSYSEHKELLLNYNALLFNPLFLVIPFLKNSKLLKVVLMVSLGFLMVYLLIMLNKPHLSLVLPFWMASVYILLKRGNQNGLLTTIKNNRT